MGKKDKQEDYGSDTRGVTLYAYDGDNHIPVTVDPAGNLQAVWFSSLVNVSYDFVSLVYTGDNVTTMTFKVGGTSGTTVATLTLAYDASDNLTSVGRT